MREKEEKMMRKNQGDQLKTANQRKREVKYRKHHLFSTYNIHENIIYPYRHYKVPLQTS